MVGQRDWLCRMLVCMAQEEGVGAVDGGWGGEVEGSVTDSHLVPVARAARVVPLSAVVFDGLSFPSSFYFKSDKY